MQMTAEMMRTLSELDQKMMGVLPVLVSGLDDDNAPEGTPKGNDGGMETR